MSEYFAPGDRPLRPGQRAELRILDTEDNTQRTVLITDQVIEAPNWTPDGQWLIFNAGGELWRMRADGSGKPEQIDTGSIRRLNNDHVLSPDGQTVFMSNGDGHLYAAPITGGEPRKVSNDHAGFFRYFLHGISPDGETLSYVAIEGDEPRRINIFTIPAAGGPDTRLSDIDKPNDGPEYSPDGAWVVYLSYPQGTLGHPADRDVILRRMRPDGTETSDIATFFGGQGTINVNSWAPDSRRFAFVAYPVD